MHLTVMGRFLEGFQQREEKKHCFSDNGRHLLINQGVSFFRDQSFYGFNNAELATQMAGAKHQRPSTHR